MTVPADIKKQNIPETQQEPDLFVDADRCDIQFVFTNLTSPAWKRLRIILQRRATVFMYNPDKTAAYVGFILTPDNARKISDLYLRIYRWKSVFVKMADILRNVSYLSIKHTAPFRGGYAFKPI